jgi:tripartite-type tricarboxylate transporter receptor subunit TctC
MLRRCLAVGLIPVCLAVLNVQVALAQDYPSKPIRLVTPPPGGGSDFAARLIAQGLAGSSLGQPLVIENRPLIVTPELVYKAPPDGYTLLFAGSSFMIGHLLQERPYDPVRDFSPVTLVSVSPNIVLVHPSLPVKSVKELIALAKSRPGELNYSSGALGSTQHLSAELFKIMAGVNIIQIPYPGTGPGLVGLIGGHTQLLIGPASSAAPHVKAGRLRALAVTSAQPSPLVPGVPTVAASGLPGYEVVGVDAIFAPAKTPGAILNRLSQEIRRAVNRPEVKEKFFESGAEVVGSPPETLANTLRSEIAKWGRVIKEAGIRQE